MVESFLTQNMLIGGETAIADYLQTGQTNYNKIRFESFRDLLRDLMNADYTVRRLCKRFSLQTSVTKAAAFNSALTDEEFAQRTRLVIPVSVLSGTAPTFTLQGTDDDGSNYNDISLIDDSGALGTIKTISAVAVGDVANSYAITKLYKKYRFQLITIGTSVTYFAYLISDNYTELHRNKTRANIYRTLNSTVDDVHRTKMDDYESLYQRGLNEGNFVIDIDDDELITQAEADIDIQDIRFRP